MRRSIPSPTYSLRCYIRLRQGFFPFFFSKTFWKTFKTFLIFFRAENEKLPGFCSVFFQLCGDDDNQNDDDDDVGHDDYDDVGYDDDDDDGTDDLMQL